MCLTDCAIFSRIVTAALFALGLPQLIFGRVDFTRRLLAKKNPAELFPLIISGDELFLRVVAIKIHARRRQRATAYEIHSTIQTFPPKKGDLFVTDSLLARHISPCNQTLFAGVFPVGLTPHAAHDPVRVEGEI